MLQLSRRKALLAASVLSTTTVAAKAVSAKATNKSRFQPFPLHQVRLKPSLFLSSVERNQAYLLSLEPDRFLHNFRQFAGLAPKGEVYGGWESAGIAGHSLGHYQSALALMYAQTGKPEFKRRSLYITQELAACQAANGDGYAGATTVPRDGKTMNGKVVFEELKKGQIDTAGGLNGGWVPIYTYHKVIAGALDSETYCQDPKARAVAIGLADYLGQVFEALTDEQIQKILGEEHGGISESYAELYARTGNARWLILAQRLRHKAIMDPLSQGRDELAGKHANTQIPKVIGLARTYEVSGMPDYAKTAMFFWETVVGDHSYVIGGNSEFEHFGKPDKLSTRLGQQTCECCNTYNMLKLTRHLYGWSGDSRYFDYYERAHLNHILSQQDPETGMYTYFSPLGAGFPRNHSTPTNSFWCCVGTGMENHSKHGESVFWRQGDRAIVNLYYPSVLDWVEKGVKLDLDTGFPYKDTARLTVTQAKKPIRIDLRVPKWCDKPSLTINGHTRPVSPKDGYIALTLKAKDVVDLHLPMHVYTEAMKDDPKLMAYLNGPLVLAADLGAADQPWEGFDPVLITDAPTSALIKGQGDQQFETASASEPRGLKLRPYMAQHHNRTAVYFRQFTKAEWTTAQVKYVEEAKVRADIRDRTVDFIRLGEQQPEIDHNFSGTPNTHDLDQMTVRSRVLNKGFFQFDLKTAPGPLVLQVSYDGAARKKQFDILVEGQVLVHETLEGEPVSVMNVREYVLPEALTRAKDKVTVRFEIANNQWMSVYEARLLKVKTVIA